MEASCGVGQKLVEERPEETPAGAADPLVCSGPASPAGLCTWPDLSNSNCARDRARKFRESVTLGPSPAGLSSSRARRRLSIDRRDGGRKTAAPAAGSERRAGDTRAADDAADDA